MAGQTLPMLSDILRDVYMGGRRIEAVKVTAWTCSQHRRPVHDKYEYVCLAAEALGTACEDLDECPHVVERKVKDGCSECKVSRYADVLDYETVKIDESGFVYGDVVYEARLFTDLTWELSRPMIFLTELQRDRNSNMVKITNVKEDSG